MLKSTAYDVMSSSENSNSDDSSSEDSRSEDNDQPEYSWDGNRHCYVNDYGTPIIWTDGSCRNNHLGPDRADSGIGVYIHGRKKWSKHNNKYPHTNQVSSHYKLNTSQRKT